MTEVEKLKIEVYDLKKENKSLRDAVQEHERAAQARYYKEHGSPGISLVVPNE